MGSQKKYEILEHTADVYIAAYGKNLAMAFENAAYALFDVMTEVETVRPTKKDRVEVVAEDAGALLYSWLEQLIINFETQEMLYSKFTILNLEHTRRGLTLSAEIAGEKFNPKTHPQKVGVKAVTYHRMEIRQETNNVTVKFILDI